MEQHPRSFLKPRLARSMFEPAKAKFRRSIIESACGVGLWATTTLCDPVVVWEA
jgi:hypothetical protein